MFGPVHQGDHALVGLARILAEAENAMVEQHHANSARAGLLGEATRAHAGQIEARHHIGHDHHLVAIDLADSLRSALGVGDGDDGVGMGVVDVFVRQGGVEYGFHRGGGRRGPGHVGLQLVDHFRVGQGFQPGQRQQMVQAHRRKTFAFYAGQVPAAALDVENGLFLAEDVGLADLDRGIAAAVQHQAGILPQQTGGVYPQAQVVTVFPCLLIVPQTFHANIPSLCLMDKGPSFYPAPAGRQMLRR